MTVAFIAVNIYLLFILVTGFLTAVNTVHPHTNDEEKEFSELKDLGFDAKGYLPKVELNKFTCKSKFGYSIHCAYVLCKNSEKTVIISHGFEGNKYSCLPYVKMYLTLGYNCIIYDQRNHGDNKKTFTSLGYYESKDLETVFNKVKKVLPKQKVLGVHGISMGAACASLAAANLNGLDFLVLDSSFASLLAVLKIKLAGMKAVYCRGTFACCNMFFRILYHFSMKQVRPVDAVQHLDADLPVLFVHGKMDRTVPFEDFEKLYDAKNGKKYYYVSETAHHAKMVFTEENIYEKELSEFLGKVGKL